MVGAGQGIEAICLILGLTRSVLDGHLARLGLPSPHDRPFRARKGGWTVWETIRLRFLRLIGIHPETIGKCLGNRSAAAVRAKYNRTYGKAPRFKSLLKCDPWALPLPEPGWFWKTSDLAPAPPAPPAPFAAQSRQSPTFYEPPQPSAPPAAASPPATPQSACGRAAGEVSVRGVNFVEPIPPGAAKPVVAANGAAKSPIRVPAGQRQLPFFGVVGGTETQGAKPEFAPTGREIAQLPAPVVAKFVIPRSESEVDFANVKWLGQIKKPLTNKVAMFAYFMLFAGGLHFKKVAEMAGKSAGAVRTIRTNAGIPVDRKHNKIGNNFDLAGAWRTLRSTGYVLQECISQNGNWFWVHQRDVARVKRCPQERKKFHQADGRSRSNTFTILKGESACRALEKIVVPFAKTGGRVGLDMNSRSAVYA